MRVCKLSYLDRIKLLMMAMMTTGHLAWAFVPTESLLSQWLHFFARSTVALACFLVVEGFSLTYDVKGYLWRMTKFALLAQIPFIMMLIGVWRLVYEPIWLVAFGNVLFTLALCILTLMACQKIKESSSWVIKLGYMLAIVLMMVVAEAFKLDWGIYALLWTLAIYFGRVWGFVVMTIAIMTLAHLTDNESLDAVYSGQLMDYGFVLAVPIMYAYDKYKQRSPSHYRLPRTLFYWYYVVHALVIGLLVQFTPYASDEFGVLMNSSGEYLNGAKK